MTLYENDPDGPTLWQYWANLAIVDSVTTEATKDDGKDKDDGDTKDSTDYDGDATDPADIPAPEAPAILETRSPTSGLSNPNRTSWAEIK
jgi:hypothetical protein